MAWLPVAHAVTTEEFGPLAPKRIEISPEAMLTMSIGMKKGETRSGPFVREHLVVLEQRADAADARAHQDPEAGGVHPLRLERRRPPPP